VSNAVDVIEARKAAIGDGTEVRRLLRLLMWWNFVARSAEEITRARGDWVAGRFPEVRGYRGAPLATPPLPPVPLKPR
jgi:Pirin C-terminal cupin domain